MDKIQWNPLCQLQRVGGCKIQSAREKRKWKDSNCAVIQQGNQNVAQLATKLKWCTFWGTNPEEALRLTWLRAIKPAYKVVA